MKIPYLAFVLAATMLSGCASSPVVYNSMGNLNLHVSAPEGADVGQARIRIDGVFVGNVSKDILGLYLKSGKHTIAVDLPGMKTYQQKIEILGDPNHQFLDVSLEKSDDRDGQRRSP